MRRLRHADHSARVEMMPLIDVVFLLLTFFIYALMVTVQVDVLPVKLGAVGTGEPATPAEIVAITIDAEGAYFVDRAPVTEAELDARLAAIAAVPPAGRPKLFVAMEEVLAEADAIDGDGETAGEVGPAAPAREPMGVDRGPVLIGLIAKLRAAGIEDFSFIGDPG